MLQQHQYKVMRESQSLRALSGVNYPNGSVVTIANLWLLLLVMGVSAALSVPEVITRPLFGDDSFYIWAATQIAHGCYPIRDFYCIDTAGAIAYFCLLRVVIGEESVGYWTMVALNVFVTAWCLGIVARRISGSMTGAVWAGFLFVVFQFHCTPAYGLVGKDMLGFPFVLGGLLLTNRRTCWLLGHLLVGVGIAVKPTLGAIWLIWMLGNAWLERTQLARWLAHTIVASVTIGIPFVIATLWAERHGWGWSAFRVNVGLSSGYGVYWSGWTLYKLVHVFAPALWVIVLVASTLPTLATVSVDKYLLLISLFLGGLVNWSIQPMFNIWYFVPFFGAVLVVAGIGISRLTPENSRHAAFVLCIGTFTAFVPATNLRWVKLLGDVRGKSPYSLVEHQSRIMGQLALPNTPPDIQRWIREEVAKLVGPGATVGVLVTDGNLLWALRAYRPGFWAVWCPSWNSDKLSEGVAAATADVIVGVEQLPGQMGRSVYNDQVSRLSWEMPREAVLALTKNYAPVTNRFGYVVYCRRRH